MQIAYVNLRGQISKTRRNNYGHMRIGSLSELPRQRCSTLRCACLFWALYFFFHSFSFRLLQVLHPKTSVSSVKRPTRRYYGAHTVQTCTSVYDHVYHKAYLRVLCGQKLTILQLCRIVRCSPPHVRTAARFRLTWRICRLQTYLRTK